VVPVSAVGRIVLAMAEQRRYPLGVPCWIDLRQRDLDASRDFYGRLFGWEFHDAMPPGSGGSYLIATLDGQDAAALAPGDDTAWTTYIACDDADHTAEVIAAAGGAVIDPPADAGPGGRAATVADPQGAVFRLWQARRRLGAQAVNRPAAWAFSDLHTADAAGALEFYRAVFGWAWDPDLGAGMIRLPGYGDHLAATADPDIYERQRGIAPEGFADVVAAVYEDGAQPSRWEVRFVVDDRDDAAASVERLGGSVLDRTESAYTREAVVADPQGARFVISQVVLPG
jgi:uncharacterized protein